ncbi:small ribosomal subunit protein cS23-like [Primulina tabacum]|uniref:small ribosomal subunit protein cS23-like n=1 Tax=Primulina tabacum TaxID=48773 RepID=UPI003F5A17EE
MLSVGFRPCAGNPRADLTQQANLSKNLIFPTIKTPSFSFNPPNERKFKPIKTSASSSSLTTQEASILDDNEAKEKPRIVVKPMERPRLVLKFVWMEKNIGIAIDQVIPGGHGTIPLSPYYFWPRKDAWEELKVMLESKPWISKKQTVVLLNQATDIITLWQQSGES